ncbi:MAG TPA: hypothetical protein DEO62_04170 [Lachnospiraceae bacterium]|nr:hypothetical protein [Lachnospiraceae bacterium]
MKKYYKVFISTISIIFILSVLYYIIFPSKGEYNSDSADTILWAKASIDAGGLFNENFEYAALFTFGGQLLMIPFIKLFGYGITANICGMVVFYLLFLTALFFIFKKMDFSLTWNLFSLAVVMMLISLSVKMREIFWQHIIYYSLGMLFLYVGICLVDTSAKEIHKNLVKYDYKQMDGSTLAKKIKNRVREIVLLLITFVWFMLCSTNQTVTFAMLVVPLLGALIGLIVLNPLTPKVYADNKLEKKHFDSIIVKLISVVTLASLLGYRFGTFLKRNVSSSYQNGYSKMSLPETWPDHLKSFFPALLDMMGIGYLDDVQLMSAKGVIALYKVVCAILLILIPFLAIISWKKIKSIKFRFMILIHFILCTIIMLGFVCGFLSAANWRISPVYVSCIVTSLLYVKWLFKDIKTKNLSVLICIGMFALAAISFVGICKLKPDYGKDKFAMKMVDYLEENGYTDGYATFWNSALITLLSNGKIRLRNIAIDGADMRLYHYQQESNWFKDEELEKNTFILTTADEYTNLVLDGCEVANYASNFIVNDDFVIMEYTFNPASVMK